MDDPDHRRTHGRHRHRSGRAAGARFVPHVAIRRSATIHNGIDGHSRCAMARTSRRALKRFAIGSPKPTEHLAHERLDKKTALAVFASDNLSSSAYATEEILRVAIVVGAAAFSLVLPLTLAMIGVLGDPDLLLPTDDQGLPAGRRRVPRHEGQLRRYCPRRSPVSRCSPTTSSLSPCRCPPGRRHSRPPSRHLLPHQVRDLGRVHRDRGDRAISAA